MSNQDRFMDDMHFCIEVLGMDDDAIQEIDKIEEEVQLKYQLPDDLMIG